MVANEVSKTHSVEVTEPIDVTRNAPEPMTENSKNVSHNNSGVVGGQDPHSTSSKRPLSQKQLENLEKMRAKRMEKLAQQKNQPKVVEEPVGRSPNELRSEPFLKKNLTLEQPFTLPLLPIAGGCLALYVGWYLMKNQSLQQPKQQKSTQEAPQQPQSYSQLQLGF